MQFVTIITRSTILDTVTTQFVRDAVADLALEMVGGLAEQADRWRPWPRVLDLGPDNAKTLS